MFSVHDGSSDSELIISCRAGAAGNFLSPIAGLSSNAFKTVLEIDTLGSFNTLKVGSTHSIAVNALFGRIVQNLHKEQSWRQW